MEPNKLYKMHIPWEGEERPVFLIGEKENTYEVSELTGRTHQVSKENAKKISEYVYKKGEKTFYNKQMKKAQKLAESMKKQKELERKNHAMLLELSSEYTAFEQTKEEFNKKTVEKLMKGLNIQHFSCKTKEGEEYVQIMFEKQIAKYASEHDFPFLYVEYDHTMHYHSFEVSEYFDVSMPYGHKEKMQNAAKENGFKIEFNEHFELGDKNTIYVGYKVKIMPKTKMNFKKFKSLIESLEFMKNFDAERHLQIKKKW